ncbi:MAG TPA: ATP-binding cassette domain-containing protein [Acidimicrobiales bacterium]|nr:ATP-binding cassette domain-containing protein [Acidimicrobiales bacterium]
MIRLESITKRFPNGQVAVDALDLDVPAGEVCMLVGPSGSGKTTTLKMINRLVEPTSGRIFIDGDDVTRVDPVALRRRIGYVIQQVGLFPHQTVGDNVATVPRLLGWDRARTRRRVDELLDLVGLEPARFRDRYPNQLSGGQRQRVGVARALGVDPPVLLMDEPFGAIDPITRDRLQQEFLRLQGEVRKTVVFVTHDVDEAVRLGDRIAILREGGVLEQYAPPAEVLGRPASPFVAEFVGADRGLKRLSVTAIDGAALDSLPVLPTGASLSAVRQALGETGAAWALAVDDGRLVGAITRAGAAGEGSLADRLQPVDPVDAGATLKDALAALLLRDDGWLPVVDGDRYCGVLTPESLHAAIRRSAGAGEAPV